MPGLAAALSATAALLLTGVLVALPAAPASAHNRVVASSPRADGTLTKLPRRFSITTDLPMLAIDGSTSAFALDVVDASGRHYGDGCIKVVDNVMSTRAELGRAGAYTVRWQLVSADGHTVSGGYPFTWAPASGVAPSAGYRTAQRCGASGAESSTAPTGDGRGAAIPLADVLWIGGAIFVLLAVGGVVLVLLTRKRRA